MAYLIAREAPRARSRLTVVEDLPFSAPSSAIACCFVMESALGLSNLAAYTAHRLVELEGIVFARTLACGAALLLVR